MTRRPNILLMIADDHRYSAIHACGDPAVQTPVLDRLIEQGVCFDRNYHFGGLVGAVCVPARACLMTGNNPFRALASKDLSDRAGLQTINPHLPTLPEVLRREGYHTHHVGKWHNDKQSFHRSFEGGAKIFFRGMSDHWQVPVQDFDPTGEYPQSAMYIGESFSTEMFGDAAIRFLRDYSKEEPFFLYCAFTAPHDPRVPPPEYAALYNPDDIPLPPNYLPEHPFDNGEMRNRDESLAPWPRTPEIARRHIADYYGMITHLDMKIGQILDALTETGRAADTIVIYTADHGLAVGQHGLLGKQNMYEHSARVPAILRGPSLPAGRRFSALTYTPDLFPTLCDLTGTPVPETVETQSVLPLVRGAQTPWRDHVCGVYKDVQRMVAEERWKLIRYYRSDTSQVGTDRIQLFDLAEDPWERHDLSADPGREAEVSRLAGKLDAWQDWAGDILADVPVQPAPTR